MATDLARRFKVDVSTDGTNWVPLKGLQSFQDPVARTTQDASDFDSDGFGSFEVTMQTWTLTIDVLRKTVSGVHDPGQEIVRAARLQFGDEARVYVRYYDRNGGPEAYTGWGIVTWTPKGNGVTDLGTVTITIQGDGALTDITNPVSASAAPVISAVTPSGAAAGTQILITGSGFTGTVATSGVKVGGTNATGWTVISDSAIVAIVPAGSAGSAAILVTNGVGPSNSFAYTRGA